MRTMLMSAAVALLLGQATARPGDIPRPDVWIKNDRNEPIPVDVRSVNIDAPLRVRVMNGDTGDPQAPLRVRVVPPTWEHRAVYFSTDSNIEGQLQPLSAQGWEAVGVTVVPAKGVLVLLKRQR